MTKKINLGCGKRNFGDDWIHIDGDTNHEHVLSDDITLSFLQDNFFDLIYSSHLIAYFDKFELTDLLNFWKNKLKEGGILRLATPDFEAMSRLYFSNNIPLSSFVGPLYGKMKMNDSFIYHKMTYDFKSLWYSCDLLVK